MTMLFDFNIFNIGRTRLLLVAVLLFSAVAAGAQSGVTVTGTVSDSDGNPLIGAAVMEQGTNNGAVTDIDGKYSIVVRGAGSVLVFNSLSYMTETMTVGDRNVINVALKDDALNLSESVVTGYGRTVSRDKLTAAISKVSGEVLENGVRSNALSALAGTVTGVRVATTSGQPGSSPSIVIRGGAALDGSG